MPAAAPYHGKLSLKRKTGWNASLSFPQPSVGSQGAQPLLGLHCWRGTCRRLLRLVYYALQVLLGVGCAGTPSPTPGWVALHAS